MFPTGIWAAAELSLTQITNDIKQLDAQVNKMNAEFIRIKDTKENIGLDGKFIRYLLMLCFVMSLLLKVCSRMLAVTARIRSIAAWTTSCTTPRPD